jgi:hypothetical protein
MRLVTSQVASFISLLALFTQLSSSAPTEPKTSGAVTETVNNGTEPENCCQGRSYYVYCTGAMYGMCLQANLLAANATATAPSSATARTAEQSAVVSGEYIT